MPDVIFDKGRDEKPEEYDLTEEEEAELEERISEMERGEFVEWDDVREAFLRRHQVATEAVMPPLVPGKFSTE